MYKPCLNIRKNIINSIVLFLSILSFTSLLFAKNALTHSQEQARLYRAQGLEYQSAGDLDTAMSLYQKALALDALYAVAYNDLGIIYEAKGDIEQAKESYLRATQIDPHYLSAYSNLALLYESKRDLPAALSCWKKRAQLGTSRDPWTIKARQRVKDIEAVLAEDTVETKEENIIDFMKEVAAQKTAIKADTVALAKKRLAAARLSYKRKDWLTALKEAIDAKSLDPDNREVDDFIDKVKTKLLERNYKN